MQGRAGPPPASIPQPPRASIIRFAAVQGVGAEYQSAMVTPLPPESLLDLRASPDECQYYDEIGSAWSTYTAGPQRGLGGGAYNDADCGQYAHRSVVYQMNSVDPRTGAVHAEATRFPSSLDAANRMTAAEFRAYPPPVAANVVAFLEPGGCFHYARVVRNAEGRVHLSHTEASTHDEAGGGGTFRIHDIHMNTYAQRGVAPTERFNSCADFAAYCERKYGSGHFFWVAPVPASSRFRLRLQLGQQLKMGRQKFSAVRDYTPQ